MIILRAVHHRGADCIIISGKPSQNAFGIIRNFPDSRYSRTFSCFYIPNHRELLERLKHELSILTEENVLDETGKTEIPSQQQPTTFVELPDGYDELLIRMRYSEATRENYKTQFKIFMQWMRPLDVQSLTQETVHQYLLYLVK